MKTRQKGKNEKAAGRENRGPWGSRTLRVAFSLLIGAFVFGLVAEGLPLFAHEKALPQAVSPVERSVTRFVKSFYGEDDILVKFNNIPEYLTGGVKVKAVSFSKVPGPRGEGLCLVEFDAREVRERSAYISFKIFRKKHLFVMKRAGTRGDILRDSDLEEKTTFLTGTTAYPSSMEEITGKRLKKNVPAGTVITSQILEEEILVRSGQIINVVAENSRLVVHARGRALERGKMGDTVRVKNLTSGKEIFGKVTGHSMVSVEF